MWKIILKPKFVRLKIEGSGLFEVHSLYRYGQTQKKQERLQQEKESNELEHNHQHFKYKSRSLESLIHMVKLLTCVWGCPVQILSGTWATCNDVFRVFLSPSGQNACILGEPPIGSQPLPSTSYPIYDSLITPPHLCAENPKNSITIHKLRKPKTLTFISCKRRHYLNCTYVAIFLNNNSIGYVIKLAHKLNETVSWVDFSKPVVNWALNHAF
jgi:hypothetical protein